MTEQSWRKRCMACITAALVISVAACQGGRGEAPGSHIDRIAAVMAQEHVPGLAMATLKNCRVDTEQYFGVTNLASAHPITATTLFESASLSKPVLAYIYLQAFDRAAVALDEPLARTFDYPRASNDPAYAALTPRHILSHRSGLPNWAREDPATGARAELKFKEQPGASFTYSGEGYQMLQAYLEARTGTSFESQFATALAGDLPMSAFGLDLPAGAVVADAHRSDGTIAADRPLTNHDALSLRTVLADYARFTSRVCRGEGLSGVALAEMFRPQSPAPVAAWRQIFAPVEGEVSWGLGWGTLQVEGRTIHFHWGDNGAFKSFVAFDRATGDGVVFFTNGENGLELIEVISDPILGTSLQPIRRWIR